MALIFSTLLWPPKPLLQYLCVRAQIWDGWLKFAHCWSWLGLHERPCEQGPFFFANKAKTEMHHFSLKHYKTRYTPAKRDKIKNPRHGQHPERDRNEVRMCIIWGHWGTRQAGIHWDFPYWSTRCPETPQKRDTRPKDEIGMNFGSKFLPPLTWRNSPTFQVFLWTFAL